MPNLATSEGTRRYAQRIACAPGHFRPWPPGDEAGALHLSSLGMGSYTGPADDEADRQYRDSVMEAIRRGVNLIDCAINYRHMRSERALGEGIRALIQKGEFSRDEIFLMTKGGYLPFDGAPPRDTLRYFRQTYLDPRLVRPEELVAGCHCIAPTFLQDQLTRSLSNFGLDAVDVYFLHNLEQQIEEVARDEFDRRVLESFKLLEKETARGRIGMYGAATWNGLRVAPEAPGHLSLERLVFLAEQAGGQGHHFSVLQLPYNLGMTEALTAPTQLLEGKPVPLLEAASAFGLMVVGSVPLLQAQLLPHVPASFAEQMPGLSTNAQRALQFVRSTPGVQAPLAGMRHKAHVAENAALISVPPLTQEEFYKLIGG